MRPARRAGHSNRYTGGLRARSFALGFLLVSVLAANGSQAGRVTVLATRDNTLFQDAQGDTSNGAGPAFFAGSNAQNLARRGLVRFELAGLVSPGLILDGVELALEVSSAADVVPRAFTLHRVLSDWGEGTSSSSGGGGAPATPGDATWLHARWPDARWGTPGGDYDPEPSGATAVGDVGSYLWSSNGLRDDVQRWLDDPATNFGWLLRGEEGVPRSVRRFDSREAAALSRPTLTLIYSEPVPSRPTTWGRLKALFR